MAQAHAKVIGGAADGQTVLVDLVGGRHFPLFLGINGRNYVLDHAWDVDPAYVWWPPGADEPVDRGAFSAD